MLRRGKILFCAPNPPLPNLEEAAWRVTNRHFFSAFAFAVTGLGLLRHELKGDMSELHAELKADIGALRTEIQSSLAALHASKGAMDAHAEFYRDSRRRWW